MKNYTVEQKRRIVCERCPECNTQLKYYGQSKYTGRKMYRCPNCGENIYYASYIQCCEEIAKLNKD